MDPFLRYHVYHSTYKLNAAVMAEAARYFTGKHDFTAFANAIRNDRVRDPIKTISRFDVTERVIVNLTSASTLIAFSR